MKFLKSLTPKKIIIIIVVLFLLFIVVDILMDPQGAFHSFREGFEEGSNAARQLTK